MLLTFFRKGKLMKFYISDKNETRELDFLSAAKLFECDESQPRINIPLEKFYNLLDKNKEAFIYDTLEEEIDNQRSGRDNSQKLFKHIKAIFRDKRNLTEDQEEFLDAVIERLKEGALPKKTVQRVLKYIENVEDPTKALSILKNEIPKNFIDKKYSDIIDNRTHKREVILSLYLER